MVNNTKHIYTLITGASSGIGKALAIECAKRKMNLLLVALPGPELEETSQFLQKKYLVKVHSFPIDLTEKNAPDKVLNWCKEKSFSVNILINFICNILEASSSKENVNMAVVNYALYRLFLQDYNYIAPNDPDVDPLNDLRSCNGEIFSGYPLNSSFKKYEDIDDVYFIHK